MSRDRVCCRVCGAAMLRPLNLFGFRELLHPDTACIPLEKPERRFNQDWSEVPCASCGKIFAQRKETKKPQKCCSQACTTNLRSRNLKQFGRRGSEKRKESPRMQRLRLYWQKRADELDQRRKIAA